MRWSALGLVAVAAWGCDEAKRALAGPDQGPQEVVFEQPLETPVATLDGGGVSAVCVAFQSAVVRQVPPETRCVPAGIIASGQSDGDPQASCAEARDTCTRLVRLGTGELPELPAGPCPFQAVDAETCSATLATLKPCLDTLADTAVGQIRETLTCALAGNADLPDVQVEVPDADGVEACAAFTAQCPGFLGRAEE
ncbi:MAG: hypothetical protein KC613_11095 [Myxococcales bacterium]|nr:hypothetical protein [Myxococcales bacterium]MCB9523393.1 hypothetical protein [Myxococcales bacterium]